MERSSWTGILGDWLWFLGIAVASSAWCIAAAGEVGVTYDEPVYMTGGLEFWRTGSHYPLMKLGTMPLPMDLATLPVYLWERATGETFDINQGEPYEKLFWARLSTLLFWWVLLWYGRLAARNLGGPWAGRLAVALMAVEPSFLAHASLATSDLAITACMLAFIYHYRTGRDAAWLGRVGWPALWFAAALLCKASALAFAPLCMLAVECERLVRARAVSGVMHANGSGKPLWRVRLMGCWALLQPFRRDALQTLAIGTALVFAYVGSDWQPQQSFLRWAHSLPDGAMGSSMTWLAENLRIFTNAGEAMARQISHNMRGHGAYLLGRANPVCLWYYFPVVLTIKLTVPLLALPIANAILRPKSLTNWACIAAGVLLLYTFQCRVQIGIRLVLPLVAIAIVGLAAASVNTWRDLGPGITRLVFATAIGLGLGWSAYSAIAVWPHGLCYVNELYGGTEDGYLRVSDGNYDWGQGIKELARWQQHHSASTLDVWYFGTDSAIDMLAVRRVHLHFPPLNTPDEISAALKGRHLAVSTSLVYGAGLDGTPIITYLRNQRPVARTLTFLIYDFRKFPSPQPE